MIFVTQKKSVYVDSVAGSDANDGLTQATPKATCAAGMTVLASSGRKTIRLKCGSFFREQITLPAGKRLKNYGAGARPILDPRENAPASWTLTSGQTKAYQQTLTHELYPASVHRLWEDGVRMIRVGSVASCESTAGSFYAPTPSGASNLVYIHPSDDGDPSSNGKTYSYSKRMWGVELGNGCVVDGITTGWNGGNDGSIRALARNCTIRNCDALDGAKHHVLISEGLCENVNAYDAEPIPGSGTQIAFIAYNNFDGQMASVGVTFKKCRVDYVALTANASLGFYGHGGSGVTRVLFEDCVVKNTAIAFGQISESAILSRCVAVDCNVFVNSSALGSKWYIYRCRSLKGPRNVCGKLFLASNNASSVFIRHSEVAYYNSTSLLQNINGVAIDMRYSQFAPDIGSTWNTTTIDKAGPVRIENSILWSASTTLFLKSDMLSFTGDNNLYYTSGNPPATWPSWASGGTTGWSFASWKANTGQDANTVIALPVFLTHATETDFSVFDPTCPVFTSGFPLGVQPTDDEETLSLLASVGYTP